VLCLRWNNLSVELEISSAVNFSLAHSGVLPISLVTVRNLDSRPSGDGRLNISIVGCGHFEPIAVPALSSHEHRELSISQFHFDYEALEGQTERAKRTVSVELNGEVPQGGPIECWVFPHNEWSVTPEHRFSLGAFVLPNHPLVVQLELDACSGLHLSSSCATVMEAIYVHLYNLWKLTYRHEPYNLDSASQRIRLPHQILLDFQRKLGQGTCLDLALLMAGCLESRGMQPVVAIVDIKQGKHALCGCWTRPKPGLEPLIFDKVRLQSDAVWVDPTGMTTDGDNRLNFESSCEAASKCISVNVLEFALDVAAARHDGILPMPFAGTCHWSEAALRVLQRAESMADSVPTRLATVPLLVGLLKEKDGLTRTVFSARFEDVDAILNALVAALPKQLGSRKPSRNYVQVLDMARSNARADCSPLILEHHLIQALLSIEGTAVDAALRSVETSRLELRGVMHNILFGKNRPVSYSAFSEFPSRRD
jgi:hypothetical protein